MGLYLSENIKKNRRESNLSQEAFAERLGVSFQTISKWERGADTYIRIAESCMNIGNADEARLYVEKALLCAEKHDAIPYGTHCESILCGCKKYGYSVAQSGKSAHPYGKLKEAIIASLKANPIFGDIVSKIE